VFVVGLPIGLPQSNEQDFYVGWSVRRRPMVSLKDSVLKVGSPPHCRS
jgi:hypothetical protein